MTTDVRPGVSAIAPRHPSARRIALVAHDNRKRDLLEWAHFNRGVLAAHQLFATGTTGALVEHLLALPVTRFLSGPLGGDQQVGAKISEGGIDVVLFFWDPLQPQPHDPDVRALLRIAVLWNVPIACNRATADYLISSPLLDSDYERALPDHDRPRLLAGEADIQTFGPSGAPQVSGKMTHSSPGGE